MKSTKLQFGETQALVFSEALSACNHTAELVAQTISQGGRKVLGLATGSTPELVYKRLVELHRQGEISFQHVITYNLDEYYPISPLHPMSYRYYMHEKLFGLVDFAPERTHVFDGTVPEAFANAHAAEYDRWIQADGGLDLQILGVGLNGHIGFNEPSTLSVEEALELPSRLVELHETTLASAAKAFGDANLVPARADNGR